MCQNFGCKEEKKKRLKAILQSAFKLFRDEDASFVKTPAILTTYVLLLADSTEVWLITDQNSQSQTQTEKPQLKSALNATSICACLFRFA